MNASRFYYNALRDYVDAGGHVSMPYERLCQLAEAERRQYTRQAAENARAERARQRIAQLKAVPNGIRAYGGEAVVVGVHDSRRIYGAREYLVTLWRPGKGNHKEWVAESEISDPSGDVLSQWR